MREHDLAWAGGLFEGEGCFTWNIRPSGRRYPHVSLTTTDYDVIQRFAEIMGFGSVTGPMYAPRRKPRWAWRAVGPVSIVLVDEKIGTYLGERRRAKLDELLTYERADRKKLTGRQKSALALGPRSPKRRHKLTV